MKIAEITDKGISALEQCMNLSNNDQAQKAKEQLVEGNDIFCENRGEFYTDLPVSDEEKKAKLRDFILSQNSKLEEVKKHQTPEIAVLACSDSRADPAAIFSKQGFNKIFVVRNAGNIFTNEVEESMVVPVNHDAAIIVVCGHYKCGAMNACSMVRQQKSENTTMTSIINRIDAIAPKNIIDPDELAKYNVADVLYNLAISDNPVLRKAFAENKTKLSGAMYDIDSGKVSFMDFDEVKVLLLNRMKENSR